MRQATKAVILGILGVVVTVSVPAEPKQPDQSGYGKIVERNMFGLVTPDTNGVHAIVQPEPEAHVKLTGVTTVLGVKRAFFVVQPPPSQGKQAKDEDYMLALGERQGNYEVLAVDEKAGTARLRNGDKILELTLPSPKLPDAPTTAAGAPPAAGAPQALDAGFAKARAAAQTPPALPPLPTGMFAE